MKQNAQQSLDEGRKGKMEGGEKRKDGMRKGKWKRENTEVGGEKVMIFSLEITIGNFNWWEIELENV